MDCLRPSELDPFIDGELDAERHEALVTHLEGCGKCQGRANEALRFVAFCRTVLSKERCPESLKARVLGRKMRSSRRVLTWGSLAASLLIALFVVDPICLRGCPTVHALTQEHDAPTKLSVKGEDAQILAAASRIVDLPPKLTECECLGLDCVGAKEIACGEGGCLIRYLDKSGRAISFVRVRGAHFHPWLRASSKDGLVITEQDNCKVVGWTDAKGYLSAFVAPKDADEKNLVALATRVRG